MTLKSCSFPKVNRSFFNIHVTFNTQILMTLAVFPVTFPILLLVLASEFYCTQNTTSDFLRYIFMMKRISCSVVIAVQKNIKVKEVKLGYQS